MKVIARKGVRVPMEGKLREYVTDAEAVDVPETTYYLRRQLDGDLLPADSQAAPMASVTPAAGQANAPDAGAINAGPTAAVANPTTTPVGDKKTTKGV